ncbi:tripartite tricarboxylate transporter substrate binding protein [soil metagenome]
MLRRTCLMLCAAAALSTGLIGIADAQDYPSRAVRVVVPYPPGGPTDIIARLIFAKMGEQLHQTFVIDNRPGAGGNTGAEAVARATPDGYTLLLVTTAHAINPFVFKNLTYDIKKDLAPVSLLTEGPLVLAVNPALPIKSVQELIAYDKANPGKLNFGSSGNGQSTHLSGELFNLLAGTKLTHVPYKGSAPAISDTIAGQVQVIFDPMLSTMPFVRDGKLRALGVTSSTRSPSAPEIPTIAEQGVKGYESAAFFGLMVPTGTPAAVVGRLNAEVKKVLEMPDVIATLDKQGFAASWQTPAQFDKYMTDELAKWQKTVAASGATVN